MAPEPTTDDAWFEAEPPTPGAMVVELQRLKRRARARLALVLLGASVLTALLVVKVARKPRSYAARIIMAVTEGTLAGSQEPTAMQELRDYVWTVLLSNERLMPIIEANDLFPQRTVRGDEYALETLRGMYDIEVYHNFFLVGRSQATEPRSVRLALTFHSANPEFAWQMVNRLTQAVVDAEHQRRLEESEFAVARARQMHDRSEESMTEQIARLNEATIALGRAEARGDGGQAAALRVEVQQLERTMRHDHEAATAVATIEAHIGLGAAVESQQLGLHFTVADERHPFAQERSVLSLIAVAILGFLILLPLIAIFIGAFDSRVHEIEDVSRLGLPVIGHVPPFIGDDVGSLARRGAPRLRHVMTD